jgi:GTPase SAR1 family protein
MPYIETSAKKNTNVDQAFSQLAEQAIKRQEVLNKKVEEQ